MVQIWFRVEFGTDLDLGLVILIFFIVINRELAGQCCCCPHYSDSKVPRELCV